jgi:hypothetical protein
VPPSAIGANFHADIAAMGRIPVFNGRQGPFTPMLALQTHQFSQQICKGTWITHATNLGLFQGDDQIRSH